LHIKRINYVINYDFPSSIEQYCHRIGRTGRSHTTSTSSSTSSNGEESVSEAYSLFTRNFSPLAKELVLLLRHCKQNVEKNLLAIVEEREREIHMNNIMNGMLGTSTSTTSGTNGEGEEEEENEEEVEGDDDDDDNEEEDDD
jgi:superfamily II DNA/RNA helicase